MPRRKTVSKEQVVNPEPQLMLPPARTHHRHKHDVDPYEAPPGVVVVHSTEPLKRKMTKNDLAARDQAQVEMKMRTERYVRYLDALVEFGGDQEQALAEVYHLTVEEVRPQRVVLQADVRNGIGGTDLAELLERNDMSMAARISLLRRHAYSNSPAASLKAIDMTADLEGNRSDFGSFESYLRLVKAQKE